MGDRGLVQDLSRAWMAQTAERTMMVHTQKVSKSGDFGFQFSIHLGHKLVKWLCQRAKYFLHRP